MNRRRIGFLFIALGAILSLFVGYFVFQTSAEAEQLRKEKPTRWVAVAAANVPERSTILADQVTLVRMPPEAIPPGAIATPPEQVIDRAQAERELLPRVVGQYTPQRIYVGEVYNADRLGRTAPPPAPPDAPANAIPAGKVWYHFEATQNQLISQLALVRPGDHVDVYYTTTEGLAPVPETNPTTETLRRLYTRRILQNLKVQNVGPFPIGSNYDPPTRIITFEVTPDEALLLKWIKDAAKITGSIEMVVRSPQDRDLFPPLTIDFDTVSRETGIGTGTGFGQ
ncbi:MAG TPA: SAF domain-containing protein [Gemmatimonadales bacterium]|nr:SAF domain-containing protein [Gemmatimonadales bacterium]